MTDASFKSCGREDLRVPLDAVVGAAWRNWRQSLHQPIDWVLLALFAALQLGDILSTNHGLALPGNHEGNPLMALLQADLGGLWWVPKAAAVFLVCLMAPLTRRRWPMIFAVSFYLLVVGGNLVSL